MESATLEYCENVKTDAVGGQDTVGVNGYNANYGRLIVNFTPLAIKYGVRFKDTCIREDCYKYPDKRLVAKVNKGYGATNGVS